MSFVLSFTEIITLWSVNVNNIIDSMLLPHFTEASQFTFFLTRFLQHRLPTVLSASTCWSLSLRHSLPSHISFWCLKVCVCLQLIQKPLLKPTNWKLVFYVASTIRNRVHKIRKSHNGELLHQLFNLVLCWFVSSIGLTFMIYLPAFKICTRRKMKLVVNRFTFSFFFFRFMWLHNYQLIIYT